MSMSNSNYTYLSMNAWTTLEGLCWIQIPTASFNKDEVKAKGTQIVKV
jgi:hypothetical protein